MVEKRVKKFGQGSPPPALFGQSPKENIFFIGVRPLNALTIIDSTNPHLKVQPL